MDELSCGVIQLGFCYQVGHPRHVLMQELQIENFQQHPWDCQEG